MLKEKRKIMIRAILFDLNGVLINSESLNIEVWRKTFDKYGIEFNEEIYENYIDGRTTKEVAADMVGRERVREFIESKDRLWNTMFKQYGIDIFDETIPFLEYVKSSKVKTAIVTSGRKAESILEHLQMRRYFDAIVGGDDIKNGKPDPEILLKAMNILKVGATETALVEDSSAGLKAGRVAGVYCIGVQRGCKKIETDCDRLITNLKEIAL